MQRSAGRLPSLPAPRYPEREFLWPPFMLKNALLTLLALAIAIVGGAGSVWYVLKARDGAGAVTIGQWTTFPDIGTPDADPYSRARVARDGALALGQAEGLRFVAGSDSGGSPLKRECAYRIEGGVPTARFWTLYAADPALAAILTGKPHRAGLQSGRLLRQPDNSVVISIGPQPAPGNWLATAGAGPMLFVLTFYDTPISGSAGLSDVSLPQILKVGCDA